MTRSPLVLAAAFALAAGITAAGFAAAQHDHRPTTTSKDASAKIAEGTVKDGVRIVELLVTEDGFVPSKIQAKKGEKLRLVVTRKTDATCAKEIVVEGYGIKKDLPLEKTVAVELTPRSSGEIRYACGMGHVRGVVFIP